MALAILKNLPQNRLRIVFTAATVLVVLLKARAIVEEVPPGICKKSDAQLVPVSDWAADAALTLKKKQNM